MKIAYPAASAYVRKVMARAIARGFDDGIERWKVGTIPRTPGGGGHGDPKTQPEAARAS